MGKLMQRESVCGGVLVIFKSLPRKLLSYLKSGVRIYPLSNNSPVWSTFLEINASLILSGSQLMARQKFETGGCDLEENVVVAATFKVLVLGNSNVGKSSLIKYYSAAEKPENMMPTIGWLISICSVSLK